MIIPSPNTRYHPRNPGVVLDVVTNWGPFLPEAISYLLYDRGWDSARGGRGLFLSFLSFC